MLDPHPSPSRRPRRAATRTAAASVVLLSIALAACSSGDDATTSSTSSPSPSSTTTTAASQFGSSMGVAEVPAADIAELGPGPAPGETWTIPFAISVCGRFIEPLVGSGGPITANADGTVSVTGVDDGTPTLGTLAEGTGLTLAPGSMTLPATALPAELDSTDPPTQVAGATLVDGGSCGATSGAVEVWVYSADATDSGDGIMVVTDDPGAVPFAEEGMSIVVAYAAESSLPTLPPSALGRG